MSTTTTPPYPESCFTDLVGIRGICEPATTAPQYWIDDIPGIDLDRLAKIANETQPTGARKGTALIETASRMLCADVEAIYDGKYKVETNLVTGCSTCRFLNNYATGDELGVVVKDDTASSFSKLFVDKFTVKINNTGTYVMVLNDGTPNGVRHITHEFDAGVAYEFKNVKYSTREKEVRLYFEDPTVLLAQLSCPRAGGGCGCSGKTAVVADLHYQGTAAGVDAQQAYGFIPCAYIACDASDLLCFLAHSAPRMIGMALLYKTAELYFSETTNSSRQNNVVKLNVEDKDNEGKRYGKLYLDRLQGKGFRGVKDLVLSNLASVKDVCVVCNALNRTQWATG